MPTSSSFTRNFCQIFGLPDMSVQTLQKCSLQSVAKDIIMSCGKTPVADLHRYKYILGPFDGLNSDIIQELLNVICDKKQLKVCHLHVLLHSNIKHLDLSVCSSLVNDQLLAALGYRCKKLTQLSLKNCSRLSTKALKQIPKNLPCIQFIDLSGCPACTDGVLDAFGSAYPKLKLLKVESCSQITDAGVDALCGDDGNPRCRKLRDVNLTSTSITSHGMEKILLLQPQLQKFNLAMTISRDAFSLDCSMLPRSLRLFSINLSYTSVSDATIKSFCEACPLLFELSLNCCASVTENSLEFIASLTHLRMFNIAGNTTIKFHPHLSQFLQKSGDLLETLNISGMKNIDTEVLGTCCRSLKCLIMADCNDATGNFIQMSTGQENNLLSLVKACPKLSNLNLHSCKFTQHKSLLEHLAAILSNSVKIQELDLSGIEMLSDEILQQLMQSSNLSHLRSLNLSRCSEISVEPIHSLIGACKNLKQLNLSHCKNISLQDAENLRKISGERRVSLNISWV